MDRNRDILRRFHAGETLQAIGDVYGITRERVRQIVARSGADPRAKLTRERAAAFDKKVSELLDADPRRRKLPTLLVSRETRLSVIGIASAGRSYCG